jgi:hypothetical protein
LPKSRSTKEKDEMENKNPIMAQKEKNGISLEENIEDRITTLFSHCQPNGWDIFDLCSVLNEDEDIVEEVLSKMTEAGAVYLWAQEVL